MSLFAHANNSVVDVVSFFGGGGGEGGEGNSINLCYYTFMIASKHYSL